MKDAKRWAGALGALLPTALLARASGMPVLLPYHHTVSDDYLPHIRGLYAYKNARQFGADLDWLLRRYRPLDPAELIKATLEGKAVPPRSFLLSFDDGFREIHDVVAPLLLRKGVPALLFINPAFVDNRELFYRCKLSLLIEKAKTDGTTARLLAHYLKLQEPAIEELRTALLRIQYPQRAQADELGRLANIDFDDYLRKQQPFMTTSQLQSLQSQGFYLGGHSIDHPNYKYLAPEGQHRQTVESVNFARRLGAPHHLFAFPHEDIAASQAFFDRLKSEAPLVFFGVRNGLDEARNRLWHRFNAENPAEPIAATTAAVQLFNALRRLAGRRTVQRN